MDAKGAVRKYFLDLDYSIENSVPMYIDINYSILEGAKSGSSRDITGLVKPGRNDYSVQIPFGKVGKGDYFRMAIRPEGSPRLDAKSLKMSPAERNWLAYYELPNKKFPRITDFTFVKDFLSFNAGCC